jgi:hypothetical protein
LAWLSTCFHFQSPESGPKRMKSRSVSPLNQAGNGGIDQTASSESRPTTASTSPRSIALM